jgi:hypothetical protein
METKDWAELQEALLAEQLRVVRRYLKKEKGVEKTRQPRTKGKSKISTVEDILRKAAVPLHVTEIIKRAKNDYQTIIDRESIVSAITKKVNKQDTFIRVDRNTFALKTEEQKSNKMKNGQ